ncbi:uncharacterized protein CCOS01_14278 [Colletotrichum costaricense]|uniref:Uncharacterized protein n=1 Tax=Colletotrichum costaricense TaxID=1209916 RepID=A0AAI9YJE4_9PEZI|nr:uncharacterized protein CCOS01_14278 [Colletotrichum costaricense]KAK1513336.1 hypothetical protein CCOS01_14278 [Colletotrichum costaricense]
MGPLTAIGLMANILAFGDFGLKALNEARIVYKSSSGFTVEAANLQRFGEQMRRFANNLQTPDPMELNYGEKVLCALAKDCCKVLEEGIKEDEPRSLPLGENRNTGHEAVNDGIGVALEHLGKRAILPKLFAHVFIVRFAATLVSVWLLSQLFELALRQIHA